MFSPLPPLFFYLLFHFITPQGQPLGAGLGLDEFSGHQLGIPVPPGRPTATTY